MLTLMRCAKYFPALMLFALSVSFADAQKAPIQITASFGAANAPRDASNAADLLKQTEIALKEAKRQAGSQSGAQSGGRRAFYDARIQQRAQGQGHALAGTQHDRHRARQRHSSPRGRSQRRHPLPRTGS